MPLLAPAGERPELDVTHLLRDDMRHAYMDSQYHPSIPGITEMAIEPYQHLVEIKAESRLLTIYRVSGTTRELYTSITLPDKRWAEGAEQIKEFCRQLGENIIFDSPEARRVFEL